MTEHSPIGRAESPHRPVRVDEDPKGYLPALAALISAATGLGMSKSIDGAKAVFVEFHDKLYPAAPPHPDNFEWLGPAIEKRMAERARKLPNGTHGFGLRSAGKEMDCTHTVVQRAIKGGMVDLDEYFKMIRWLLRTGGIDTSLRPPPKPDQTP